MEFLLEILIISVSSCARQSCVFHKSFLLTAKFEKWTKSEPKTGFFEFFEKFDHKFLLNLSYNENLYYLLCSCINPIFGEIFIPEIRANIFSANQIVRFLNQPYLQSKSSKKPAFLHVYMKSHKLKADQKKFGCAWSKMNVSQKWIVRTNCFSAC